MKRGDGLLVVFDERQREKLLGMRSDGSYAPFTDALWLPGWKPRLLSVALLGFSDATIDYIALAKKGNRVATSKSRIEFSDLVDLGSIPVAHVESRLGERLDQYVLRSTRGLGGVVPQRTWEAIISVVKALRPERADDVDRLLSLRSYSGFHLDGAVAEVLLQEREAVGAALDIFSGTNQLRERVLGAWAPPEDAVVDVDEVAARGTLTAARPGRSSFLRGIPGRHLQEDAAILHDMANWDGMSALHEAGVAVFRQGGRTLEVIYANNNALEHTLGVDLVYHNEKYDLFVLVQHKLMKAEGDEMVYRPDKRLRDQIRRMDAFSERYLPRRGELGSHQAYRLNTDGFMVKLVPNRGLRPASGELIKGMYLTREYAKFLIGPRGPRGPGDGPRITFDDAPRYLTNSEFTRSVNRGWIGTEGVRTDALHRLIREFLETGSAVVFAREMASG